MTPRVPMVELPRGMAHCRPLADCLCRATCARAERARCDCSWVIDASVAMRVLGDCPMFIDKRGLELADGTLQEPHARAFAEPSTNQSEVS